MTGAGRLRTSLSLLLRECESKGEDEPGTNGARSLRPTGRRAGLEVMTRLRESP